MWVCSAHDRFKGDKIWQRDDVSVVFALTKSARPSSRKQSVSSEAMQNLKSSTNTEKAETVLQEILSQSPDEVHEYYDNLL